MIATDKLAGILARFDDLAVRLSAGPPPDVFVQLSRDYADLEPAAETARALLAARRERGEAEALARDADPDLRAVAEEEMARLDARLSDLDQAMALLLVPKDADDEKSAILEIRAGTGGDEAALFAGDLLRMYERYAQLQRWQVELLSLSEGTVGGVKEVVASVSGRGVFAKLRFESGVHRVQRVPATETQGRIHTSAATVAVLPEIEEVDIVLDDKVLRIETMRAGGAGGQHVNKTESAIRITHLPTGITVVQQDERSQHRNKATAMKILRARLYDHERTRRDAARAADRRGQVGSGDRSERIRTYNFPQGRVTDHRIGLTLYDLERVVAGDGLDQLIEPLLAEHRAALLAAAEP